MLVYPQTGYRVGASHHSALGVIYFQRHLIANRNVSSLYLVNGDK